MISLSERIKEKPLKKKTCFLSKVLFKQINSLRSKWVVFRQSDKVLTVYKAIFYLMGIVLPINKRLIIFESFHGKQYSDNPRALYEYMKGNTKGYRLIWSVDRRYQGDFAGKEIKYVRRFSFKWLLLMVRAKYWITNARLPLWIPKPKNTVYLQTWHGTPLKRLAADMDEVHIPGTNTVKYKEDFLKEASKWDYLVSPNAYSSGIFKKAFKFNKTIIESGYPRNDLLINANDKKIIDKIKTSLHLSTGKKVILYAPTWRDNQFYEKGKYKFDLQMDLERLKEELGDKYIIILRLHYLVAENLDLTGYEGFVYDYSGYEDIRQLYLIADLLITDYSSVFFDYANLKRPIIFYVYDIEDYRDNLRGFYFDLETEAPGPLVRTTVGIIEEVKKIDHHGFKRTEARETFYEKFCYLDDGKASERVMNMVFKNN